MDTQHVTLFSSPFFIQHTMLWEFDWKGERKNNKTHVHKRQKHKVNTHKEWQPQPVHLPLLVHLLTVGESGRSLIVLTTDLLPHRAPLSWWRPAPDDLFPLLVKEGDCHFDPSNADPYLNFDFHPGNQLQLQWHQLHIQLLPARVSVTAWTATSAYFLSDSFKCNLKMFLFPKL